MHERIKAREKACVHSGEHARVHTPTRARNHTHTHTHANARKRTHLHMSPKSYSGVPCIVVSKSMMHLHATWVVSDMCCK